MYFVSEPEDVRRTLIERLALSAVPMAIMGITFVWIGAFVALSVKSSILMVFTVFGGVIVLAKIALMAAHRRANRFGAASPAQAAMWENTHAITTIGFAVAVGTITAATFTTPDLTLQMLATALLFGYCSGIVCRLSIRPFIAMPTMAVAAVPVIVAAMLYGDAAHGVMAGIFSVFLVGSTETVRFIHTGAVREIGMRLDFASLAQNDPLTGLANRLGLRTVFRDMTADPKAMVAVHFVDLDNFKPVNDRYGHAAGDEVLRQVSLRLKSALAGGGLAARIGGDEFVVLQPVTGSAEAASHYAARLSDLVTQPYRVGEQMIEIGASLGYAVSSAAARTLEQLLAQADTALYGVKRSGGGVAAAQDGAGGSLLPMAASGPSA